MYLQYNTRQSRCAVAGENVKADSDDAEDVIGNVAAKICYTENHNEGHNNALGNEHNGCEEGNLLKQHNDIRSFEDRNSIDENIAERYRKA